MSMDKKKPVLFGGAMPHKPMNEKSRKEPHAPVSTEIPVKAKLTGGRRGL